MLACACTGDVGFPSLVLGQRVISGVAKCTGRTMRDRRGDLVAGVFVGRFFRSIEISNYRLM